MYRSLLITTLTFFLTGELFAQCYPTPTNLVGWWDGDNVFVDTTVDIRNGMKGKLYSGATTSAGMVCNAYEFDGTDDYLLIADDDKLTFSDGTTDLPFSIETWVFVHDMFAFNILSKGGEQAREYRFRFTGTNSDHLSLGLYDDQRPNGGNANNIGLRSVTTFSADTNKWMHVAATYDGSGVSSGIKLYMNGVQLQTMVLVGTDSLGTNYVTMRNQSQGAAIGRVFTDFNRFSDGLIDELGLYNRVLTAAEIQGIYNSDSTGRCLTVDDTDTSGCHPTSTGFNDISKDNRFSLFPNPSNNEFSINIPVHEQGYLKIFALDGKMVYSQRIEKEVTSIRLPHELEAGMYFVRFNGILSDFSTRLVLNR